MISVTLNAEAFLKRIAGLKKKVSKNRVFFFLLANRLDSWLHETFRKQGARTPEGKWKAFSLLTLHPAWKARKSNFPTHKGYHYNPNKWNKRGKKKTVRYSKSSKILQDTRTLEGSFKKLAVDNFKLAWGSRLDYAKGHQTGEGNLPVRKMLFVSKEDTAYMRTQYARFITR